jgi:hypothetical protein
MSAPDSYGPDLWGTDALGDMLGFIELLEGYGATAGTICGGQLCFVVLRPAWLQRAPLGKSLMPRCTRRWTATMSL